MDIERLKRWSVSNWFLFVAPALLCAGWLLSRSIMWASDARTLEAALLIDACITLPVLYALCYGRSLPLWRLAVRMVGIGCLGIYLLTLVVPPEAQLLLPSFGWARIVGLVLLALVELRVIVVAVQMVFRSDVTAEKLSVETGAPPLIARLMILEARCWKAVWRAFHRLRF